MCEFIVSNHRERDSLLPPGVLSSTGAACPRLWFGLSSFLSDDLGRQVNRFREAE